MRRGWLFLVLVLLGCGAPAWAEEAQVEVGERILFRVASPAAAKAISQRVRVLMEKHTPPKILHLQKVKAGIALVWGKALIVVVDKKLAMKNKSQPAALARVWLKSVQEAAEIGLFEIHPDHVVLPINGQSTLVVSGLAGGEIKVGDTQGLLTAQPDTDGNLQLTAKAVGRARVAVHRGSLTAYVTVHIKDWAGYLPERLTVQVTGNPAPPDMVVDAALRILQSESRINPGCQLSAVKIPPSLPSIPPGQTLRFTLPVHVEGNDDYYPVTKDMPVEVGSLNLPPVEPNILLISNRPEQVEQDGLLLNYTCSAKEPCRLMYSHLNGSQKMRNLWVNLKNPTNEPIRLLVDWTYAGPSRNLVLVGHQATERFFEHLSRNTGFVLTLGPHATTELAAHQLEHNELLTGFVNVRLLEGKQVEVRVLNKLSPGVNDHSPLAIIGAPFNPFKIHPHGVFAQPFFEEWLDHGVGQSPLRVTFGESPWLIDFETGLPNTGNFGVVYRWHVALSNPTSRACRVGLIFTPKNGAAAGTFLVNGQVLQTPFRTQGDEAPVTSVELLPQQEVNLDITTLPEASSSYPATLTFRDLRPGEDFGPSSLKLPTSIAGN